MENLFKGLPCGKSAQKIYDGYAAKFGWDASKSHMFGMRKPLFADSATPEKYSVWFICHSNWSGDKGGEHLNLIMEGGARINEYWSNGNPKVLKESEYRVTFAKMTDGEYCFLGVYKIGNYYNGRRPDNGQNALVREYKLISETYPR